MALWSGNILLNLVIGISSFSAGVFLEVFTKIFYSRYERMRLRKQKARSLLSSFKRLRASIIKVNEIASERVEKYDDYTPISSFEDLKEQAKNIRDSNSRLFDDCFSGAVEEKIRTSLQVIDRLPQEDINPKDVIAIIKGLRGDINSRAFTTSGSCLECQKLP